MKDTDILKRYGRRSPDKLLEKLRLLELSDKSIKIMKLRYVDKIPFKQIPELVGCEERWMFRLHNKAINKMINMIDPLDFL